ncbi:MAG: MBL fold metallo-hydrolase [Gemmatimonadales bacterium]
MSSLSVTYVGGPTALVELAGLRFLTDPTFDAGGSDYPTTAYTLHKTQSPAIAPDALGAVDAVLLSHDHHFDNLDHAGRVSLAAARATYTTRAGAERLAGNAIGMEPWESAELAAPGGGRVRVSATPARHGPVGGDRGPVVGFVLESSSACDPVVYFSGDTVWFDGVAEVGRRFDVDVALLNVGAAKVAVAGPHALSFTAEDAVALANAWPRAAIVPLHFEGWTHFTEGHAEIATAFGAAGASGRLHWLPPGRPVRMGGRSS